MLARAALLVARAATSTHAVIFQGSAPLRSVTGSDADMFAVASRGTARACCPARRLLNFVARLRGGLGPEVVANVRDEQNAVVVRGRAVGEIFLSGKGAGSLPTAAAVLADVIELAA